jgi:hypothetical protein
MPYSSVYQRLAYGQWIACESLLFLERHLSQEPVSFFSAKERGFWGTARQEEVGKDPANYRGNALENQQPPPAWHTQPVDVVKNDARDWRARDVRHRICGHEGGDRMAQVAAAEPVGQVQQNARKISSLGNAEEKPRDVQMRRRLHESGEHRHDSPTDQNTGYPLARADLVKQQVARNLEKDVAGEKHRGDETILLRVDPELRVHGQRGKSDVVAIEGRDHEENENERNDPRSQLADRSCFDTA